MTVLWKLFFIIIFFTLDIWSQTNPNQGIEAQNHKKNKSISSKEKKLQQNLGKWTGLDLEKNKEIPIFLVAGSVEYKDLEDGSKVWIATKGVHAWQGEVLTPIMELFCEQAVVWILNEEQKKEYKQQKNIMFYAEEKVHFRWEDNFFRGEQIYFDLVNNHGLIGNGSFRVQQNIGEKKYPLYVRAEKIRILSKEKIIGENASFSTCRFGVPHYHFETGKVIVRKFNEEIFLQSRDNTIWGLDFPLFTIPYITGETIENFPLKKISYGKKSNWGQHLLTRWGGNLYKDDNIIKRAKWFLDLDTRAKRGIGVGPGITYSGSLLSSDEFKGRIYGYYSHDQPLGHLGKSMDREQKKGEYATWSKRHRMYILHRHKFANNWSLDAE
ncbi:MAG TPA: hypothetical protein PKM32_09520, partial [Planctomycetota bacterium]|nr:hypothetical protein [Planctomycetota bacterium]